MRKEENGRSPLPHESVNVFSPSVKENRIHEERA